uniref:Transmembrane channel-like protein n=1 Tax=Myripristis murdjan TaxID=586833 RepID=A0A667WIX5_9TELE
KEMEEHQSVNFMRLLSDESGCSILSEDSCVYHHTEIYEELPSSQAARHRKQGGWQTCEAEPGRLPRGAKDKTSTQPLRNLLLCLQGKREARNRRNLEIRSVGFWESWRRSQSINRKRVWAGVRGALSSLLPWQHVLHSIEGRFGVGVKSYFVFLRYLVYMNLLHCVVISSFILGPTAFYGREPLTFEDDDSFLDFFLGSGFLERSPVFFGYYTRGSLNLTCLNTPLLYLNGVLAILILSLIMVVRRTAVSYKHMRLLGKRYSVNVSFKIFCGWDFTIQDHAAASLKRSFIRNDLKLYLEEQSFSLRKAQRTLAQRVRLYTLRIILNLLVVSLLGGAFYLIYFATITSQSEGQKVSLILQYLPPIAITSVNLVLPHVFRKVSSFEDYSFTTQVNVTLLRSIFLKLASLGMYLFFLFRADPFFTLNWEKNNQFGREMYKLCIFDFLASFCNTFLLNYPRKWLYPSSLLTRLLGKQRFLIPDNVLDLVYHQTVSWVGVYYCPLLPLLGTVKLVVMFYIKKFTVLRCCVAEQRMFRASSSSVLFHFMLLLGLFMAVATFGFNLYQFALSSSCGPFANGASVFNVTGVCVDSLPGPAQSAVRYLASEAFALPLILAEIVILTSYVSRGRANQRAIERLKDMLVMCSSDKRFLVKQHTTMLRNKKRTQKARTTDAGEDSSACQ